MIDDFLGDFVPQIRDQDDWRKRAACAEQAEAEPGMRNAWVDEKDGATMFAKMTCGICPVKMDCAMAAVRDLSCWGLYAGYFFRNGTIERRDARKFIEEFGVKPQTRDHNVEYGQVRAVRNARRARREAAGGDAAEMQ